jgi:hypothetical protein
VSLEGALGKISRTTNKTPKQAIQVAPQPSKHESIIGSRSEIETLRYIEKLYDMVLRFDEIERKKSEEEEDDSDEL